MDTAPPPIEPPSSAGRKAYLVLRTTFLVGIILIAVVVLFVAGRILLYRQVDDEQHLAIKRTYLSKISEIKSDVTAGPNFVVILFDDLGHGDLGAYGGEAIATPNLDRLAAEGLLFKNAYSPSPYCSASRAGLMTGRYAVRSGLDHVVQVPGSWQDTLERLGGLNRRLPAEEITLAEVLQAAGYATGIIGKWHLGEPVVWNNREIIEDHPIDQTTLTRRYTEKAVAFIEENRDRPFFLYLPHTFPHIPLHVGEERLGHSAAGLYGDVVEELDWSTGEVLDALERTGVADNTLIVVSSDNGPWFQGSPGGVRGRKFDVFEGGMRVPFLVRWPVRVAPGGVDEDLVNGVDVFPTVLELLGIPAPPDRVRFHQVGHLRAVRLDRFKFHDRHRVPFGNPPDFSLGVWTQKGPWLFDLELDPDESYDVSERHPETSKQMGEMLEARRQELEDNPRGWK